MSRLLTDEEILKVITKATLEKVKTIPWKVMTNSDGATKLFYITVSEYQALSQEGKEDTIEDGHGGMWSAYCPECGKKSMVIKRPGDVQCSECD